MKSSAEKRDCATDTRRTNGTGKRCKLFAHQARSTTGETISLSVIILGFGRVQISCA